MNIFLELFNKRGTSEVVADINDFFDKVKVLHTNDRYIRLTIFDAFISEIFFNTNEHTYYSVCLERQNDSEVAMYIPLHYISRMAQNIKED